MRALRVAVASPVLGARLVGRILGLSSIRVHGHKVQSTVQPATQLANVDVKGELPVQKLELLVGRVGVHQVRARPDVLAIGVWGHKVEREGAAAG